VIVVEIASPAVFEKLRSKRIGVTILTFRGHLTSSVTWPFDTPYSFPIGGPLQPSQASIPNGFWDIQRRMQRNGWPDLDRTSKQRSRSFSL